MIPALSRSIRSTQPDSLPRRVSSDSHAASEMRPSIIELVIEMEFTSSQSDSNRFRFPDLAGVCQCGSAAVCPYRCQKKSKRHKKRDKERERTSA